MKMKMLLLRQDGLMLLRDAARHRICYADYLRYFVTPCTLTLQRHGACLLCRVKHMLLMLMPARRAMLDLISYACRRYGAALLIAAARRYFCHCHGCYTKCLLPASAA